MVRDVIAMRPISRLQGWFDSRSGLEQAALAGKNNVDVPTGLYNDRQLVGKRRERYRSYDRL